MALLLRHCSQSLLLLLFFPLVLFQSWRECQSQMLSPFSGQGVVYGSGEDIGLILLNSSVFTDDVSSKVQVTKVFVSCYLDRLLKVNEQDYGFEAVIFMRLSWTDPRAIDEVYRRTNETYLVGRGDDCKRPCHAQYRQCCDSVWLPGLDLVNVWGLPQDRVDFERISFSSVNHTQLDWTRRFNGVFYTPMNFRRFPFDRQVLIIEFWGQACCHELKTSSVSTTLGTLDSVLAKAADLSSWEVSNLTIEAFQFNMTKMVSGGTPSNAEEIWAVKPPADKLPTSAPPLGLDSFTSVPDSLRIYITVNRLSWYYVISYKCPMILCVMLSWWTFWISPHSIEARLSVLIALFLALTALQFVISSQLPASSYITVMGWVVVVSYVLIALATMETMLVYCLFRHYVHGRDNKCVVCEESRGSARTADGSIRMDSVRRGNDLGSLSAMDGKDETPADPMEASSVKRDRALSNLQRHSLARRLLSYPVLMTLERTRIFDSNLRRDLARANKIIWKIEAVSICTFPLLYSILLAVIISCVK